MGRCGPGDRPRPRSFDRLQSRHVRFGASAPRRDGGLDLRIRGRHERAAVVKSSLTTQPLGNIETPLLAVIIAQGQPVPVSDASLERAIAAGDYKGKKDETLLVYGSGKAERVMLVGIGKATEVTRSSIRRGAAVAAKRARTLGTKSFTIAVAKEVRASLGIAEIVQVAIEGAAQGGWQFTELKKQPEDPKPDLESVDIAIDKSDKEAAEAGRRIGDAVAAGYLFTRNLQMQPGNVCTPTFLGEQARKLATTYKLGVTILDLAQIRKEGMGALLAVAQGSAEEPRFIVLEYQRSEEHTSELQSQSNLVCRLLLEKKKHIQRRVAV